MFRRRNPKFDFNQAVADARRDYAKETEYVTFVDLSSFWARRKVRKWVKEKKLAGGATKADLKTAAEKLAIREIVNNYFRDNMGFTTLPVEGLPHMLIGLKTKKITKTGFAIKDNLHFRFNHELGHAVVPNGNSTNANADVFQVNREERVADGFGLMRCIAQGVLTKAHVLALAAERAARADRDKKHATAPALEQLAERLRGVNPADLTPKAVKNEAQRYGIPIF
jgi:hypothetical protein